MVSMLQVLKLEILLKISQISVIYTVWAFCLPTYDSTWPTHNIKHSAEVSISTGDGGENDNFDTCAKLHENVFYMCNTR